MHGSLFPALIVSHSCLCRQKRSHRAPAKEGNDVPTASLTGQYAAKSPPHKMQAQQGSCQEEQLAIQQALRETLEQCMRSEQLPQLTNLPQVCYAAKV